MVSPLDSSLIAPIQFCNAKDSNASRSMVLPLPSFLTSGVWVFEMVQSDFKSFKKVLNVSRLSLNGLASSQ